MFRFKCPLCGLGFNKSSMACKGCPFINKCEIICCPNCNYQWPKESKLVNLGKKIIASRK